MIIESGEGGLCLCPSAPPCEEGSRLTSVSGEVSVCGDAGMWEPAR